MTLDEYITFDSSKLDVTSYANPAEGNFFFSPTREYSGVSIVGSLSTGRASADKTMDENNFVPL